MGDRLGKTWGGLATASLVALSFGCGGEDSNGRASAPVRAEVAQPAAADTDAVAEAEQIFKLRCTTCHGPSGAGDGPGSLALTPPPRNFQDSAWQDEVSDEDLTNIIMYGGAAVGRSPTMPGNPDLSGKPAVVEALVAYVRGLRSN